MEKFESRGVWWLPDKPDDKVAGILKYDPTGETRLDLIGTFKARFSGSRYDFEIIHGISIDAEPVTLWKCYGSHSWVINVYGIETCWFVVDEIFVGRHYSSGEDIVFESFDVTISNLDEWSLTSGFEVEHFSDDYAVKHSMPISVSAEVDGHKISLKWDLESSEKVFAHKRLAVSMRQISHFDVKLKAPLPFEDFMRDIYYHLQNFVALGVATAVYPLTIDGKSPGRKERVSIFADFGRPAALRSVSHPSDMLFSLQDISDNFSRYLTNWFGKSKGLGPMFHLYFGTLYTRSQYIQSEFLFLAQALEAYHARIYDGYHMSEEEYRKVAIAIKEAIPKTLTKEHQQALKSMIDHQGNRFTLARRLHMILNEILKPFSDQIDRLISDRNEFVNKIKDTRNYLTHYGKKSGKYTIADSKELYRIAQVMKLIIQMCFLVEMEFPIEQAQNLINRNTQYRREMTNA